MDRLTLQFYYLFPDVCSFAQPFTQPLLGFLSWKSHWLAWSCLWTSPEGRALDPCLLAFWCWSLISSGWLLFQPLHFLVLLAPAFVCPLIFSYSETPGLPCFLWMVHYLIGLSLRRGQPLESFSCFVSLSFPPLFPLLALVGGSRETWQHRRSSVF